MGRPIVPKAQRESRWSYCSLCNTGGKPTALYTREKQERNMRALSIPVHKRNHMGDRIVPYAEKKKQKRGALLSPMQKRGTRMLPMEKSGRPIGPMCRHGKAR